MKLRLAAERASYMYYCARIILSDLGGEKGDSRERNGTSAGAGGEG